MHVGRTNKLVDSCYSFWQGAAFAVIDIIENDLSDDYGVEPNDVHSEETDDGYSPFVCSIELLFILLYIPPNVSRVVDLSESGYRIHEATADGGAFDFNQLALQSNCILYVLFIFVAHKYYIVLGYLLHCAQSTFGGLRDKPSKSRDFYHRCVITLIALAQYKSDTYKSCIYFVSSCYALSGLSIAQWFSLLDSREESINSAARDAFVLGDSDNVTNYDFYHYILMLSLITILFLTLSIVYTTNISGLQYFNR
jgi:hypothetical protein